MINIDSVPVFSGLSDAGKKLFKRDMILKKVGKSIQVLQKGSEIAGAYVVINGRLRVYSIAPSGAEATLYWIDSGETCVIALNCLFQNLEYPAWVETEEATEVAVIHGDTYRNLFKTEQSVQDLTVEALSTSVFRLMSELEQLHFFKLEHRLASFLLTRASDDGLLKMTHQDIAYHLGTAREVISRTITSFAQENIIETSRGAIKIIDSKALEAMLNLSGY